MREFEIFYHVAILQSWRISHDIIFEHINKTDILDKCSKFYFCVNGDLDEFNSYVSMPGEKFNVIQLEKTANKYEFPTINFIRNRCQEAEINLLYLHTKGASLPANCRNGRSNHLDTMCYNVIGHYEECLSKLDSGYDACGLAYYIEPFKHYSGNIWWTKSSHVNKLIELKHGIRNFNDVDHPDRHDAEKWICSQEGNFYGMNYIDTTSHYYGYTYADDNITKVPEYKGDLTPYIDLELIERVGINPINYFKDLTALESGGPSEPFRNLGVYQIVKSCDNINFTNEVWLENKPAGHFVYHDKILGNNFWADATNLPLFEDNSYDLLLSSDNLEHIANPLRALHEWKRLVKNNGYVFLILPRKESNFDHLRPYTEFEHILDDFKNNVTEHDMTHLDEILELHDLERDPWAKPFEWFKQRSLDNIKHRCLHHHVFNIDLIKLIFDYMNFETISITNTDNSYFALARVVK